MARKAYNRCVNPTCSAACPCLSSALDESMSVTGLPRVLGLVHKSGWPHHLWISVKFESWAYYVPFAVNAWNWQHCSRIE